MKKYLLAALIMLSHVVCHSQTSQFSFKQLVRYSHLPFDTLDDILSRKGFSFTDTKNIRTNTNVSTWTNNKGINLGIISTPDTISLMSGDTAYAGYADVIKKGVCLEFAGRSQYELLESYTKAHLTKYNIQTKGEYITVNYSSPDYTVRLVRSTVDGTFYGYIEIEDMQYEVGEIH